MNQTPPASEIQNLKTAIAALESQRSSLGEAVVEAALKPLHERLQALQFLADERKRVTVLFADVSGFTAMSETLDHEDVAAIMNACFERLTTEINRYGGTVDKYIGDAIMALFGAPRALESHEEMAVRAALGMQRVLTTFSAELESTRGFALRMRIGLNTGEVLAGLVGGVEHKDYTVMGDAVNLASRLEHACPVGRILISADTARPLHALFEFEPPQQITVKGKVEPVTVYIVIGSRIERGRVRGFANLSAPMIGREAELVELQAIGETAFSARRWQIATVTGEAGVGKSRLRREFIGWLAQQHADVRVVMARCYAHTRSIPYYLMGELTQAVLGLSAQDDPAEVRVRFDRALRVLDPFITPEELSYRRASLTATLNLSFVDDPLRELEPAQRRDRIFLSLEAVLLSAAQQAPLVVVIEDLHWIDEVSLAFIRRWLQTVIALGSDQPAMLLLFGRPPDQSSEPMAQLWPLLSLTPHRVLALHLLDVAQTAQLVRTLLQPCDLPVDLIDFIVNHAQGNPFFVEELIRLFIEDGTLIYEAAIGSWQAARPVSDLRVPDNVRDVLAARLDRLIPEDKRVAQYAAVIGRTFWQMLLTALLAQPVDAALLSLEERQMALRLAESQIAGDWEWLFRSRMLHDVAYEMVTRAQRRQLHRLVAEWLEAHAEQREAFTPQLAWHYEQAEVADRALHYLRLAADQAERAAANRDTIDFATRALRFAVDEAAHFELLGRRNRAYGQLGDRAAQWADLQTMLELAEHLRDDQRRAQTLNNMGLVVRRRREFQRALDYHRQALALFQQSADRVGAGRCLNNIGTVYWNLGDTTQAFAFYQQALDLARQTGERRDEGNSLANIGTAHHQLGDYSRALQFYEQALAVHQASSDRYNEGVDRTNLGEAQRRLGRYAIAREHLTAAIELCRKIGDREGELYAVQQLASAQLEEGDTTAALSSCAEALRLAHTMNDEAAEAAAQCDLSMAHMQQARWSEALSTLQRANTWYAQDEPSPEQAICLSRMSMTAWQLHEAEQARAYADQAIAALGPQPDRMEAAPALFFQRYRVLTSAAPDLAQFDLATAYRLLRAQAQRISDVEARQSFLNNIALHQSILHSATELGLSTSST